MECKLIKTFICSILLLLQFLFNSSFGFFVFVLFLIVFGFFAFIIYFVLIKFLKAFIANSSFIKEA